MKKVLFLSAALALVATTTFAQSKKPSKAEKSNKVAVEQAHDGPKVDFKATTIDLGNVPQGVPAEAEFVFKNTGNTPIVIQKVTAACGCTTPSYTKDTVLPGKSGSVKAAYNAANPGSFNKNITVITDAGTETLWIKGNVEATPETSVPVNKAMMKK